MKDFLLYLLIIFISLCGISFGQSLNEIDSLIALKITQNNLLGKENNRIEMKYPKFMIYGAVADRDKDLTVL